MLMTILLNGDGVPLIGISTLERWKNSHILFSESYEREISFSPQNYYGELCVIRKGRIRVNRLGDYRASTSGKVRAEKGIRKEIQETD